MTLGILGGGQLGRMTAFAALRMGLDVRFLVPEPADSVACFAGVTVGDWNDPDVLRRFAEGCDAVTVESEWAPADRLADAAPGVPVWPSPETLRLVRDKAAQRRRLAEAHLPQPPFRVCESEGAFREAAGALGLPVVVKRRRGSYDGYGNATVRQGTELAVAWARLADTDGVLVEAFVPFEAELSVIVARSRDGETVVYPVFYTEQRDHRCHAVVVPSGMPPGVEAEAVRVAVETVEAVGGVGLVAVELFALPDGQVLVNEIAPRPHNTGHLTIEACHTSQFENHARAVLGLPLGRTELRTLAACMVNVLGTTSGPVRLNALPDALTAPGVAVHLYGKRESRPRRKMGHVTALGADPAEVRARAEEAARRLVL
jgi:5-(carboxyamino)imidazole ribonucleotide synthase